LTEAISSSASLWLALSVLGIPLLSSLTCFLISEKFAWLAPLISSLLLLITAIFSALLFFEFDNGHIVTYSWPWFSINQKILHASLLLDSNALIMLMVVSLVSLLVHLYSIGYMAEDHALVRYFGMLGFFTFAMLGLVMSSNLLVLFCFWELVGFSSYRLIGHWYEKPEAAKASTKAFLINRVGDLGFLIGLMILWAWFGNLDITHLNFNSVPSFWLTTAGICIFLGVIGKSAQFPLFHWLPDAMEGPTPVSALIHAATMVAAGVFLLIRVESLFTEDVLIIISIVGAVTSVIGAMGALFQYDIKKILAYSTISQLGFMVMAIGAGSAQGGYMHLLHHAFFKAGLFLGAGAIIHAMHQAYHHHQINIDIQDIRNLGGLRKKLPITFITFLIGGAALAGIPLTSGFVSKELILTQMSVWSGNEFSWKELVMLSAWAITFLTPVYTFRLIWFIFFQNPKYDLEILEVPFIMRLPMLVLSFGSLALLTSFNSFQISSIMSVFMTPYPAINHTITLSSIGVITFALVFAFFFYRKFGLQNHNRFLTPHFYLDWISDQTYNLVDRLSTLSHWIDRKVIDKVIHGLTYLQVSLAHITGWSDRYIVDGLVSGVAYSAKGIGLLTRSLANGKIQSYMLWALAGLLIFILWILY
jgi:NADH-quinone oxidoreductase subunit L